MKKFELAKDFEMIGGDIIPSGTPLQLNNGKYYLAHDDFQMGFTKDQLINNDLFKETITIESTATEIDSVKNEEDSTVLKKWRIQLDIVTTESKRKKIQQRIQEVIEEVNGNS